MVDDERKIELAPTVGEGTLSGLSDSSLSDLVIELALLGEKINGIAPRVLAPVVCACNLTTGEDSTVRNLCLVRHSLHDTTDTLTSGGLCTSAVNRETHSSSYSIMMPDVERVIGYPPRATSIHTAVQEVPAIEAVTNGLVTGGSKTAMVAPLVGVA